MEFHVSLKKSKAFRFKNKFNLCIEKDIITFSKKKSDKNDIIIQVTENTEFFIQKIKGKEYIVIENGPSLTLKFSSKKKLMNILLALKSTKYANSKLHADDFKILSYIGQGYFGLVSLAQYKNSNEMFALKRISKSRLYSLKSTNTVLRERQLLEHLNNKNPFLVKMEFAFQDAENFYIGLEYVSGGNLRHHLKTNGKVSSIDLKIYLAEIAICLDFLHKEGIIYRDLKPDNVLIASDGHIKLTDFGLSKYINKNEHTSTFCGTNIYVAPEIITNHGYSYEIDWYQLGVLAYELSFEKVPFDSSNSKKLMEKIINEEPQFLSNADPILVDLIKRLMEKNPKERMNFDGLKNHMFFKGFSFDNAFEKKYKPSFIPSKTVSTSTSFFSQIEPEIYENSLLKNDQNLFNGFSFISDEFNNLL